MKATKLVAMLVREIAIHGDLDMSLCGRDCANMITLTVNDTGESECCGRAICDGDLCKECKEHTESYKFFQLEQ